MPVTDVVALLDRLDRISRAVRLGCAVAGDGDRPVVAQALRDTAEEAVVLGNTLTRDVAYDDMWGELAGLADRWGQIETIALMVATVEPTARELAHAAADARDTLRAIDAAASAIDSSAVELAAHPHDRQVLGALGAAIAELEAAADQAFVSSLGTDAHGRLDAAMAVLTSSAARASRERLTLRSRRGA